MTCCKSVTSVNCVYIKNGIVTFTDEMSGDCYTSMNCVYIKNGIVTFTDEMSGDCNTSMWHFIVEVYPSIWLNCIVNKYKSTWLLIQI